LTSWRLGDQTKPSHSGSFSTQEAAAEEFGQPICTEDSAMMRSVQRISCLNDFPPWIDNEEQTIDTMHEEAFGCMPRGSKMDQL